MSEWLTTDNIAIGVLIVGCAGCAWYIRLQHNDNRDLQKQIRHALMQGIDIGNSRISEIVSISSVMSSHQRAIANLHDQLKDHTDSNHDHHIRILNAINNAKDGDEIGIR